ncbi:MAG: U32 family peptidase [Lachnospiraceae bacterium]|nr:U32 family peptidase [Lachnospiraceae bacterium]
MNRKDFELLSPAGSFETLLAVLNAGADAVYIGGEKFSARAYATNLNKENVLKAIDIGHMNDKKIVLAVNTLMKNREIEEELYDYILPYYENGLDAVIVQDLGVASFLKKHFPSLPLHASTQMTLCNVDGVKLMEEIGMSRSVLARELSLKEIADIHKACPDMELETFVHGALCYSYSGQCLMSSILGGRSGNRGRCAGPCRLNYDVLEDGKKINSKDENYPLSLKDLCTIDYIPQLCEVGVYSFKLEGRMKSTEYAAGVVSIYREYLDRYINYGKEGFSVSAEDSKALFDLGNRCGFTSGYLEKKNDRDMVTLQRPNHIGAEASNYDINKNLSTLKLPVKAHVFARKGEPLCVTVFNDEFSQSKYGNSCEAANNRPTSEEVVIEKVSKAGDDLLDIIETTTEMDNDLFLSMSELKNLRREAVESFKNELLSSFKRNDAIDEADSDEAFNNSDCVDFANDSSTKSFELSGTVNVSVETLEQLKTIADYDVNVVYIDPAIMNDDLDSAKSCFDKLRGDGKKVFACLPYVIRNHNSKALDSFFASYDFDGYLVRSYDGLHYVKRNNPVNKSVVCDHSLYTFSDISVKAMKNIGVDVLTVPFELNKGEISHRDNSNAEMVVYGRIPLMITAGCINKTFKGCDKKQHNIGLKDRYGIIFPVKNNCAFCYNTLYNSKAVNLFNEIRNIKNMGVSSFRISLTTEDSDETGKIMDAWFNNKALKSEEGFTYGHYKRGVE